MAKRRMFSLDVVDTDRFLDMPTSSQALYFHLGMRADDDGFVSSPKKICTMIGSKTDDLKILISKGYLIPFDNGVVVITDWNTNNWIRADRHTPTIFLEELKTLNIDENGMYKEKRQTCILPMTTQCQPSVNQMSNNMATQCHTQVSIGKDSIGKDNINIPPAAGQSKKTKHKYGEYKHVLLSDEEKAKLVEEYGQQMTDRCITHLDEYIEMKGYKAKSHYLAIRKWVVSAVKERQNGSSCTGATNKNRFNSFPQRNYDVEELEKTLLSNNGGD